MQKNEVVCPHCGRATPPSGARCVHCGGTIRICARCGAANKAETAYCAGCGAQLSAGQPAANAAQPYVQPAPQYGAQPYVQPASQYEAQPQEEGPHQYLIDLWVANDPHAGAYKVIRALRVMAAVFMGIGYFLAAIGLVPVLMFYLAEGAVSIPAFVVWAGEIGCWVLLFFGLVYAALHLTYYLYTVRVCGRWLKQHGIDGHAMLCNDLRVSETDTRNNIAMAMFVPGMGYARNSIQHRLRQGKDAVYLSENPADFGRYLAGKILGAAALLLAAGGLCALVWGAWQAITLVGWLIPAALLFVAAIVVGILSITAGNIALKRNAWINDVWAARTGQNLDTTGRNWRR